MGLQVLAAMGDWQLLLLPNALVVLLQINIIITDYLIMED